MSWFSRKKSAVEKKPFPRIIFNVAPSGIDCFVEMPDFETMTREEIAESAQNLASVIFSLAGQSPSTLAMLQQAVGHCSRLDDAPNYGEYVLVLVNQIQAAHKPEQVDDSRPLILPSEAFGGGE